MYCNTFKGCCKISLLTCSTSTSSIISGIASIQYEFESWTGKITSQNVSSQPNTCSRLSSLTARCSRSSVSHTMAYLHFVTYTHSLTHAHARRHTHTLTLTGQYTFSPSTRPVAFLHKRNSQIPSWELKSNPVKTDSYFFLACWPNTGKVAANISSVLHWISWMDVLATQGRGFNSNKPPLWKLCFLLSFQALQNIFIEPYKLWFNNHSSYTSKWRSLHFCQQWSILNCPAYKKNSKNKKRPTLF